MALRVCAVCGKGELLPYKCSYCGEYFCSQHRLPEQHGCLAIRYAAIPQEINFKLDRRFGVRCAKFIKAEAFQLVLGTLLVLAVGYSFTAYNVLSPEGSFIAVGFATSFLVHELAHKISARSYGIYAEFRLNPFGALLTAISLMPFLPIKFVAPGAIHLSGFISRRLMGRVAALGPSSNLIISAVLFPMALLSFSGYVTYGLALVNTWIAFFNLLPFEPFDGAKVMGWSFKAWTLMFGFSLLLFVTLSSLRFF